MYIYYLKRLYKANINLRLLSSITLPPLLPPLLILTLTPSLLQDSSSWLFNITVYRAVRCQPFQSKIQSLYKVRSPLIKQLYTSLYILTPSLYNFGVGQYVIYILYALVLTQANARFYYIIKHLGTLAEQIKIINSVTMHSTAPYKARIKVIIVNFCTCYKQGLIAIIRMVQQQYYY